jgi:hypothetical protein
MDRACFFRSSPVEIDGLLERLSQAERRRMIPAALICSVIANVNRDPEQRSEPWSIQDFMLGEDGPKTEEEEMIAWLESLESGEFEEIEREQAELFKQKMKATFLLN